MASDINNTVF